MSEHYIKKIDRVTAILTQLQSKPLVRAKDLSEKFDVSIRTIYRDIKTLENAGIPIIGEAGNGYSLMDGYKLPPVMFTKEEVVSFIAAEKLMQKFSDQSLGKPYQNAMEKLRSVLRYSDKNLIKNVESQLDIFDHRPEKSDSIKDVIPIILESISDKKQLKMDYQTAESKFSTRNIEAVGVFFEYNYWYMIAFCTMRNDIRNFRIDRIKNLLKTHVDYTQNYGNIADYRVSGKEKVEAKILVDKKLMPHIINSKKHYGFVSEEETTEGFIIIFETDYIEEYFPRWLIGFGDYMKILEPEILKKSYQNLLNEVLEKSKQD